jgi:hypothetical protein
LGNGARGFLLLMNRYEDPSTHRYHDQNYRHVFGIQTDILNLGVKLVLDTLFDKRWWVQCPYAL